MTVAHDPQKTQALHVLVVDDQEHDQVAIARYLSKTRLNIESVASARDCKTAIAFLESHKVCVALVDYNLPDGSGLLLIDRIRRTLPQTTVIAITGESDDALAKTFIEKGAQDSICKDRLCPESLETSIRHSLERHRLVLEVEEREKKLLATNKKLATLCDAQTDFLTYLSHEVRTPLALVTAIADLLANTSLDPKQSKYVRSFQKANSHILEIVNDILDVTKFEALGFEAKPVSFSMISFANEFAELAESACQLKNLEFSLKIAENMEDLVGSDPRALKQVLLNLLNNAIKFTDRGSIQISICEIKSENPIPNKKIEFSITDSGEGISEKDLRLLFKKFSGCQSKQLGQARSSGLGLHLSKEIIDALGGEITVTSKLGQGTCFRFQIDNQSPQALEIQSNEKHSLVPEGQPQLGRDFDL